MGINTIALLHERQIDEWPAKIREAVLGSGTPGFPRRLGDFSFGHVLARANEGASLMITVRGNAGTEITHALEEESSKKDGSPILRELRLILNGHGYTVRRPGRSRGEGPLCWGFSEEVRSGKQSYPDTNPLVPAPGAGVAVILLNDLTSKWPEEITQAMDRVGFGGGDGFFGYGRVLSVGRNDSTQIAGICGTSGQKIRPDRFVDPRFLEQASDILRRNGHAVREPGAKRYAEPFEFEKSAG